MTEIDELTRLLDAVREAEAPLDGLFRAAARELKNPALNDEWRMKRYAAQRAVAPAVDACLAAGVTRAEVETRLAGVQATIERNGPRLYVYFPGRNGWDLKTKP